MTNFLNNGTHKLRTLVGDVWEEIHTCKPHSDRAQTGKESHPQALPATDFHGLKTEQVTSAI